MTHPRSEIPRWPDGRIDASEGEALRGTAATLRALADELERGAKEGR